MPMEDLLTRQAPHSQEAEQSVLGSMLIDSRCISDVVGVVRPEDFYLQANREIYETMYEMFSYSEVIDPVTDIELAEGASLEMDTVQLGGVTSTTRKTRAVLQKDARLVVRERIMTDGDEYARTDFVVRMEGEGGACDLVSRSVARGNSRQEFYSTIKGNAPCTGHSECDAILAENGKVLAQPGLEANHVDAQLIHEAAIGKIAGEQLLKLRTLGLTSEEAEEKIIQGFLK